MSAHMTDAELVQAVGLVQQGSKITVLEEKIPLIPLLCLYDFMIHVNMPFGCGQILLLLLCIPWSTETNCQPQLR